MSSIQIHLSEFKRCRCGGDSADCMIEQRSVISLVKALFVLKRWSYKHVRDAPEA